MSDQVREYSSDEKRVSDYIQTLTNGMIGSGDDPIGFLIASHAALVQERKVASEAIAEARVEERKQCAALAIAPSVIGTVSDSGCYTCFENIARAILARGTSLEAGTQFGEKITATYTNYRGETSERTIIPKSIRFGSTDWHPEPQLLLLAFDVEKQADREFAVKDFKA